MVFIQHINFLKNCKSLLTEKSTFFGPLKRNQDFSAPKIQILSYNLTFCRGFVKSRKLYKTSISNQKTLLTKKIKYNLGQRKNLILPKDIGQVFFIHNGKSFLSLHISPKMLGHKFGEFALTRKKPNHKKN